MRWNSRAFFHFYNSDNTSTCRELKAVARYFYGNRIMHVFNKLYAFESTALLRLLKPRSWLPVPKQLSMRKVICWQSALNWNISPILLLTTCDSFVPQLCQIDMSRWGLLSDLTHEILPFLKISQIKTNLLKTHLKMPKTKNLNSLYDLTLEISPKPSQWTQLCEV